MEAWAGERHVAERGAEGQGVAPLAAQGTATDRAAAMPGDMGGRLSLDDAPLQVAEQGLALAERQADRLDPLVILLQGEDLLVADRLALVGDDPQPDFEAHRWCPKLDFPQCLERKTRTYGRPSQSFTPGQRRLRVEASLHPEKGCANPCPAPSSASPTRSPPPRREGLDYLQTKAVFKAARQKAGSKAPKARKSSPARLSLEEELRFIDQA